MKKFIWLRFGLVWGYLYNSNTLKRTHFVLYKGVPQKYGYSKTKKLLKIKL